MVVEFFFLWLYKIFYDLPFEESGKITVSKASSINWTTVSNYKESACSIGSNRG